MFYNFLRFIKNFYIRMNWCYKKDERLKGIINKFEKNIFFTKAQYYEIFSDI